MEDEDDDDLGNMKEKQPAGCRCFQQQGAWPHLQYGLEKSKMREGFMDSEKYGSALSCVKHSGAVFNVTVISPQRTFDFFFFFFFTCPLKLIAAVTHRISIPSSRGA